jgi:uncharacterized membrane protein
MNWLTFGVQWLHMILGILWFGYSLSLAVIIIPAINRLALTRQREIGEYLGERGESVFTVVGPTVIALGFIRGTWLGPLHSVSDVLGSAYGLTWLVALFAATATFLWGRLVISAALNAMNRVPLTPDGTATPELLAATDRVKLVVVLELVGFVVVFTCMVLMRFGL